MRVERKTPANGVVGLDWEGGPLPVGGLSLGGGSSVDERGVLFLRILFLLNGRRGAGSGEVSLGGKVVGGWVCKEANVRHLGKERKKKKVSKGGA
jgi:hypothetical protein